MQIDIFQELYPHFKFNKDKITLFEAFAGIGSQHKALKKLSKELNFKLDVVGISEFDKYAVASYNEIHGKVNNLGDITKIGKLPNDIDIFTYSFPCTDISSAGKQDGLLRESGTSSSLLWEVERLLKVSEKPKVLLLENVKALSSEKFIDSFNEWLLILENMGYCNYWEILNAKDYGIPQNRERVFVVSVLGKYYYKFPKPFELNLKLKDMLEEKVDEKYYLSDKLIKTLGKTTPNYDRSRVFKPYEPHEVEHAKTITTRSGDRPTDNFIIVNNPNKRKKKVINKLRIRKLTPKECWRLMGFDDEDLNKAKKVNSNAQLYKQAGNSIVVNVLYHIFKQLF